MHYMIILIFSAYYVLSMEEVVQGGLFLGWVLTNICLYITINALDDYMNISCILCIFYGRGGLGWALFGMGSDKHLFIYYN